MRPLKNVQVLFSHLMENILFGFECVSTISVFIKNWSTSDYYVIRIRITMHYPPVSYSTLAEIIIDKSI